MRVLLAVLVMLAFPATAAAQGVEEAVLSLASDPVYVADGAELAGQVDANALRDRIGEDPVFVAVLPAGAAEGSPGRTLIAVREALGLNGRYALVVGDDLRTLPAEPGEQARADHPDDIQAALTQFIDDSESGDGGGAGGVLGAVVAVILLLGVLLGGTWIVLNRRRDRKARNDGRSEVGQIDQTDDFVRLGDQIRALELDVTLGEAGRADYERALAAYTRANDLNRQGDEPGANRALDDGLAAIATARERIAGR